MRDGLTIDERAAIRAIETRQSILATLKDTDMVRGLLHQEVQKIRAAGLARVEFSSEELTRRVAA